MNLFLEDEITRLIARKNEGEYWDYKQEHHTNKAALVHDILCLANSRFELHNGYIIYGVEDKTGRIVGVESDPNRKSQHEIAQFLLQLPFAGQNRPTVFMYTLPMEGHEVDILEIQNDHRCPYYLEQDKQDRNKTVRKLHIYTRNGSMNTPMDRNADPSQIEELWKKRFGLLLPPALRFSELVENRDNWACENGVYYHIYQPEFTMKLEEVTEPTYPLYFVYTAPDPGSAKYWTVHVKYHATTLYTLRAVEYDSNRLIIVLPQEAVIPLYQSSIVVHFSYFIKDEVIFAINRLLYKQRGISANYKLYLCVPLFETHDEYVAFTSFVVANESEFLTLADSYVQSLQYIQGVNNDTTDIIDRLKHGKALVTMLNHAFRNKIPIPPTP